MIPRPNISPDDELLPGSTLGKYEILRKLATGGMAELYLARSRGVAGFEKTVVLKRILPHVAVDETFVHMFLDEARLAATLQHPNIADVYDVGEVDGNPFFTMEYVHGQDVRAIRAATRRRGEPVPLAIALAIIHGTASALDYAHGRTGPDGRPLDLVHRDVSSSNIVVSYDGAIKLLDFGIARAASHQHKTQVGALKGKTPYMSPEQCRAQQIDRRSDLFSLGTVMFELTVGQRPFRGENDFAVMEQIVHGQAPRPSSVVPGYPEELEAIAMKLLASSADARYQTAEGVLHDLERFIGQYGLWVSSRPLGKYMRLLFADRIDAWERAASEGVTLSEHVAETITSESQGSQPFTPEPELRPVAPRVMRLSQEFPAVSLPSRQMAAVQSPLEEVRFEHTPQPPQPRASAPLLPPPQPRASAPLLPPMPPNPAVEDPASGAFPELRPLRRGLIILVALIVSATIAAVIVVWPVVFPHRAPTAAKSPPTAQPSPAPTAAKPAPGADEPAAQPPAPEAAAADPGPAATDPPAKAGAASEPASPPAPLEGSPGRRPAAGKRGSTKPPAKAPPRVPSGKPPETPPQGDAWDRDSPFLPPSS